MSRELAHACTNISHEYENPILRILFNRLHHENDTC